MATILFGLFVAWFLILPLSEAVLPPSYESMDAADKQDILWTQIENSPYTPAPLPKTNPTDAESTQLFNATFVHQAFTYVSDEEPPGHKRLLHPYGAVAKIEMVMFPNSTYTGLFKSGGIGLVRLSLGLYDVEHFTPGMVFKILIDERPSINFFIMRTLDDQGTNNNFFALPCSNILENPHNPKMVALVANFQTILKTLPERPEDKLESAGNIGLYEAASEDCHGTEVTGHVKAPYKLIFKPNSEIGWDPRTRTDFRVNLMNVPEDSVPYGIYAKASPTATKEEFIGQLVSRSAFLGSRYGDQTLFFKHPTKRWKP